MICETCKTAGQYNAEANKLGTDSNGAKILEGRAVELHLGCPDKNCACQHVIGDVLDHQQMAQKGF